MFANARLANTLHTHLIQRSLYKARKMPFFILCKSRLRTFGEKKLFMHKMLQSFFGIHASLAPVKDGCAKIKTTITRSKIRTLAHNHQICLFKCSVLINTNQTWKHWSKTYEGTKCLQSFFGVHWHVKNTLADAAARGRIIALLFHSFESFSKRSHLFQNEWIRT